jgi:tetratricopeptide (TPR) repeat protein
VKRGVRAICRFLGAATWAAAFLLTAAAPLRASQSDPRLPGLFDRLAAVRSAEDARRIESEIWGIWSESGSPEIDALLSRGTQAMNEGQLDTAIRIFGEAIERAPDFAEGWNKRATALYQKGDYQASIRDVEVVLRLEPRHFAAISGMGLIYTELGADAPALHWFERALGVHPRLTGLRDRVSQLRRKLSRDQV